MSIVFKLHCPKSTTLRKNVLRETLNAVLSISLNCSSNVFLTLYALGPIKPQGMHWVC